MERIIRANSLRLNQEIVNGMSTRFFGNMKFDHNREEILKNRHQFLKELGILGQGSLVRAGLVHGNRICRVTGGDLRRSNRFWQEVRIKNCDGLITDGRGIWLAITVADCLPILLWDDDNRVVGAVHSGWRGTLVEIARRAVKKIKDEFEIGPRKLNAFLGPSIGPCCFEVQENVWSSFKKRFPNFKMFRKEGDRKYLDLREANLRQLTGAGILKRKIEVNDSCTACQRKEFFSRRAGDRTEAQMALIGIKN